MLAEPRGAMAGQVLKFWFEEIDTKLWWVKDEQFDAQIGKRFGAVLERAGQGELAAWRVQAQGRLAEVIVLDQFSRNIHRDTPLAFARDPVALVLAQEAVSSGAQQLLSQPERGFLLMPYMHSESRQVHAVAEGLFREFAPHVLDYELKHKAIVDRFGRYPHRNEILGRVSTPEELEFLKTKGSSF